MSVGPCTKQTVTATIILPDGSRYVGTNYVRNHQPVCPRGDLPTGEGYWMCVDICDQAGHAEKVAVKTMIDTRGGGTACVPDGGVCYIEGHTYACGTCKAWLKECGITDIRFEAPPQELTP